VPRVRKKLKVKPDDPRLDQIVGLIDACALDSRCKAKFREAAQDSQMHVALGVDRRSRDRDRANDDIAAILAAYYFAKTNETFRIIDVLKQMEKVQEHVTGLGRLLGSRAPCGFVTTQSRSMIEQAAFQHVFVRSIDDETHRIPLALLENQGPVKALAFGSLVRWGTVGVAYDDRAPVAAPNALSATKFARGYGLDKELVSIATKCEAEVHDQLWGGIELLHSSVQTAMDRLWASLIEGHSSLDLDEVRAKAREKAGPSRVILAKLVLAWGAVELQTAWCPDRKPSTTRGYGAGLLAAILSGLHSAAEPGLRPNQCEDQLFAVVAACKAGRSAFLFDGRTGLTRWQRVERLSQ